LPGVGVLAVSAKASIDPLIVGARAATHSPHDMPSQLPDRLEAGTQNLPGIAALGQAAAAAVAQLLAVAGAGPGAA